jgi:hypothetical protein
MTQGSEQIIVTITPDGAIVAETRGIKGTRCLDYISVLEDLLDAETSSSNFTPEYVELAHNVVNEEDNDLHQR